MSGPYRPLKSDNLMHDEGDVEKARTNFISTKEKGRRFRNLDFLLKNRYEWMNKYIKEDMSAIEIGAGAGFSHLYLKNKPMLTDAQWLPWIEKVIDAMEIDIADNSIDVVVASHNIHHFYSPYKFFNECSRILKKDGVILIREINTSLIMRILLRAMRHEGWNYNIDVFDSKTIATDKDNLWEANCAIPELLFRNNENFEKTFPDLKIIKNELCECFIFPLSGGVISKTKVPELPEVILRAASSIDNILIKLFPSIFACGRNVVIQRR